jgi:hypothetical protein
MVTEQHLNGSYYKYYQEQKNEHLLFLLPGQSLTPRAFWEFKLPDGKTHTDYFVESGIDVVLFDPVGYGNSKEFYSYDRIEYSNQIVSVLKDITKQYKTKTIFGFSTTTAPTLVSGKHFDKIIIHSPCIRNNSNSFVKHGYVFDTNVEKLKTERIQKISDLLIPKSNKIENWDKRFTEVTGKTSWSVPAKVMNDVNNYWSYHKSYGFNPYEIPPILSIVGEYDNEITSGGYETFKSIFNNFEEVVIPNSTHFSMWENNCSITRQTMIDYCLK